MAKILGGVLIVVCAYMIGNSIIVHKLMKIKIYQNLISFFKVLQEQLKTNYNDVTEAIIISCEKSNFEFKKDFICFANAIQKNDTDTFKTAYEVAKDDCNDISMHIIGKFANLLDENGFTGVEKSTSDMIEILKKEEEIYNNKFCDDKKLVMNFSVFTGVLIVIILI